MTNTIKSKLSEKQKTWSVVLTLAVIIGIVIHMIPDTEVTEKTLPAVPQQSIQKEKPEVSPAQKSPGIQLSPAEKAKMDKMCSITDCPPGTRAVTVATKGDGYYACGTRELAEYTNMVMGLVAIEYNIAGRLPNISDKTGEPEFKDKTKDMIDLARMRAGVSTFDEAVSLCVEGIGKLNVMVLNDPEDSLVSYVGTSKNQLLWLPKAHLDRK